MSSIHIGWRRVGNQQQTRPYVPARTMWGALTARITRGTKDRNYIKIGEMIDEQLRFSYFYFTDQLETPLNCSKGKDNWPWVVNNKNTSRSAIFDWKFLDSYAGSPLNVWHRITKEGGLHETEHVMSHTREGKQVYLSGIILESKRLAEDLKDWKETINKIQLGGERSYGWGRINTGRVEKTDKLFGMKLDLDSDEPKVILPKEALTTSHVCVDETSSIGNGKIEILAGRMTTENGKHGRTFAPFTPYWAPGTISKSENSFVIGPKGIWR